MTLVGKVAKFALGDEMACDLYIFQLGIPPQNGKQALASLSFRGQTPARKRVREEIPPRPPELRISPELREGAAGHGRRFQIR